MLKQVSSQPTPSCEMIRWSLTYPYTNPLLPDAPPDIYLRTMRKKQKYSKEEMYLAIELWQESILSQGKFCSREMSLRILPKGFFRSIEYH